MIDKLIDDIQVRCSNCSLDTLCLPRGLSEREVERISEVIKRKKTLQRGKSLYREGDAFKGILAIKSGTAKLIRDDQHGNEHIINILLPGELLGFDGFSGNRHSCSAIALETLSYCELPADDLETLCLKIPGLMREMFRHTGEKLNHDSQQIVRNKRPAEERLAAFLINLSERFHRRGFSSIEFNLPLTRQEMGNHLGLALETVSRQLKKFQDQGLITVNHKNIQIHDIPQLKKLYL